MVSQPSGRGDKGKQYYDPQLIKELGGALPGYLINPVTRRLPFILRAIAVYSVVKALILLSWLADAVSSLAYYREQSTFDLLYSRPPSINFNPTPLPRATWGRDEVIIFDLGLVLAITLFVTAIRFPRRRTIPHWFIMLVLTYLTLQLAFAVVWLSTYLPILQFYLQRDYILMGICGVIDLVLIGFLSMPATRALFDLKNKGPALLKSPTAQFLEEIDRSGILALNGQKEGLQTLEKVLNSLTLDDWRNDPTIPRAVVHNILRVKSFEAGMIIVRYIAAHYDAEWKEIDYCAEELATLDQGFSLDLIPLYQEGRFPLRLLIACTAQRNGTLTQFEPALRLQMEKDGINEFIGLLDPLPAPTQPERVE